MKKTVLKRFKIFIIKIFGDKPNSIIFEDKNLYLDGSLVELPVYLRVVVKLVYDGFDNGFILKVLTIKNITLNRYIVKLNGILLENGYNLRLISKKGKYLFTNY